MGTNNFYNGQASRIFAVSERFENEDGDMVYDETIWEDTRTNVIYELISIDKDKSIGWDFIRADDVPIHDDLRSFPATSIGQFYNTLYYAGVDITITIIPKTVSGYNEGFNLDFDIRLDNDQGYGEIINDGLECGVDNEDMEFIFEEYEYQEPYMKGMLAMHGEMLIEKINNMIADGVERLEKIFSEYSSPLVKVAQFSNGEAVYEHAQ